MNQRFTAMAAATLMSVAPVSASYGIEKCASETGNHTINVGSTTYVRAKDGDSNKVIYFIPNIHVESDTRRDEIAIRDLIDAGKIQGVGLEGLSRQSNSYSPNVIRYEPSLKNTITKNGTRIFGTEDTNNYENAVSLAAAYFKLKAIEGFTETLKISKPLVGMTKTYTIKGFVDKFYPVMKQYGEDLKAYTQKYPKQDITEGEYKKLVWVSREKIALQSFEGEIESGTSRIAIKWGESHITNFIKKLCDSSYTLFVADQEALKGIDSEQAHVPDQLQGIIKTSQEMLKYFKSIRDELQEERKELEDKIRKK